MKIKFTALCCMLAISFSAFGAEAKKKAAAKPAAPMSTSSGASSAPAHNDSHDSVYHSSGAEYGTAGCGLGSMIFGNKPGIVQIFAATTNGTVGSQTFGITTGTLNCKPDSTAMSAELFITVNKEAFTKDASRGSGESIENFAQIVGCKDSNMLGNKIQKNYNTIFNSSEFQSSKVSGEVMNMIHHDSELSKNCKKSG